MPAPNTFLLQVSPSCANSGGVLAITARASSDATTNGDGASISVYVLDSAGAEVYADGAPGSNQTFYARNLYDGEYRVYAQDQLGNEATRTVKVSCGLSANPYINTINFESISPVSVSAYGEDDGEVAVIVYSLNKSAITATVEGHTGDFDWKRLDSYGISLGDRVGYTFRGLTAGIKTMYIRSSDGQTLQREFTIGSPAQPPAPVAPAVPKPFFGVPLLNSLRYVVAAPEAMPNFDNRTFCGEDWPGVYKVLYYQKVARTDVVATQFVSNYPNHTASLYHHTSGQKVADMQVVKVRQNRNLPRQYAAWLTSHAQDANQSRLYFNGGKLPLDFVNGDTVELQNATVAGANGVRSVVAVSFDANEGIPFVVISLRYPAATPRINVTAVTQYDVLPFDVFQFTANWNGVANGEYVVKITASGNGYPAREAVSEPLALYPEHPHTHLVTWRNYDDAQGLIFTNGFLCGLRVESVFNQRNPGGSRKVHELPTGELLKLASVSKRRFEFETQRLPPWLHEKLAFIFDLDRVEINGVAYQTDTAYEAKKTKGFALSPGSIEVQMVESVVQNSHDFGDVDGPGIGFIIVNNKYLKV